MSASRTNDPVLRVSYIWRDEVMSDLVFAEPASVTLGSSTDSTFVMPQLGLPPEFEIFRPGTLGYVVTVGPEMTGELHLGHETRRVDTLQGDGDVGGFGGTSIKPGDYGLIKLDASGDYSLFFQFTRRGPALPKGPALRDTELLLPAFAFATIFIGFFLVYALWYYEYKGPSFLWPGRRELVADYLLSRPPPILEEMPDVRAGTTDGAKDAKPASTAGAAGKSGGKGEKERKRAEDPDKGEPDEALPTEVQVGLLSKSSRKSFDKIRNRGGFDKKLGSALARLTGPANNGSNAGYGDGKGTGIGPGEGTGTLTKGTGKGPGGAGSAHADVRTQGKLNTGGKRAARGTPGGNSVKERAVKMKTGKPSGSFGGLTPEQIMKVVRTRARTIQACYSRELQRNKGLGGKIQVTWKINSAGQVSRAKVRKTTLRNAKVEDCVVRQINSMKFPSPKGGGSATVNFPFIFGQQ